MKAPKVCPKCQAIWIWENGVYQHYWTYRGDDGKRKLGNEDDLAGLVCNVVNSSECINPKKGSTRGDSLEKRISYFE